jgi:hypothetical protein
MDRDPKNFIGHNTAFGIVLLLAIGGVTKQKNIVPIQTKSVQETTKS